MNTLLHVAAEIFFVSVLIFAIWATHATLKGSKKTSKPTITKQMLIDRDACSDQVDLFEKKFGDSVVVTIKRAEKVAALFDWGWAACLLDAQGQAEYKRVTVAAKTELDRAKAPAFAKYKRTIAAAAAKYNRIEAAAWAEYNRATADGWDEYNRAVDAALAEYDRAKAPAWDEYKRAIATAWASAFIDMHKRGELRWPRKSMC